MHTIATLPHRAKHLLTRIVHPRRDILTENEWLRSQLAQAQVKVAGYSAANAVLAGMVEHPAA